MSCIAFSINLGHMYYVTVLPCPCVYELYSCVILLHGQDPMLLIFGYAPCCISLPEFELCKFWFEAVLPLYMLLCAMQC